MAILRADNLQKSYGDRVLFSNVSFEIQPHEHTGMIGINGSGKTTLLQLVRKTMVPDFGSVFIASGARVSYVEQIPDLFDTKSLLDFALEAFSDLIELEKRLTCIIEQIEKRPDERNRLIALQDSLLNEYQEKGGNTFRARTRSALIGLGFSEDDLLRPIVEFSGGQVSKAMLARAILRNADILLLDEPTNNLDIVAIRWLEEYINSFRGAVLMISHDRAFLDATVTRIFELSHGTLKTGKGNYTRYQELKMTEMELARKKYLRQQKEIRRIQGIIDQQRRWNQAHNYVTIASKQKQIERIKEEMILPEAAEKHLTLRFPDPKPTGNEVIVLKDLGKSFGKKFVFDHVDLMVLKGQCVCIIGENGCGKSTLLKIITGAEDQTAGTCKIGAGVQIGYYAQHTRDLNESKTLLEEMYDTFPQFRPNELRGFLGMFLFSDDDIYKKIGTLSGGERARVQLLKLMLSGANVLVLDEPTNHLDIASSEALESAVELFPGTVIIVSHDRYLVNKLADQVTVLTPHGLIRQRDESEDMFEHIQGYEKRSSADIKKSSDNPYQKRKEIRAAVLNAKQSIRRIENEIEQNDLYCRRLQEMMNDAVQDGQYQKTDEICKLMTIAQEKETDLYSRLELAENELSNLLSEETE